MQYSLFSSAEPAVSVSDVTVTRVNDTAVMVTWMNLTLNDARGFPSYVVSVTSEGKEVANHSTHSTSVVVGGLMPHTEYNITVQALTAGGTKEGPLSAPGETMRADVAQIAKLYTPHVIHSRHHIIIMLSLYHKLAYTAPLN